MSRKLMSVVFVTSVVTLCAAAKADLAGNYRNAIASFSPIASWAFEDSSSASGSVATSTNSTYNGTYGSSITQTTGVFGTGILMNGAGWVSATNASLPTDNAARSAIVWCKTTEAASSAYHGLLGYGTTVSPLFSDFRVECGITADGPGNVCAGNYGDPSIKSATINDGAWHMIAITVSPTTAGKASWSIYTDGTLSNNSEMTTTTALNSAGNLLIGAEYTQGTGWIGSVDEVSMFSTALTADNVHSLYNSATVPEPASLVVVLTGLFGLLAYAWRKRR
jgi:hypothetical protein